MLKLAEDARRGSGRLPPPPHRRVTGMPGSLSPASNIIYICTPHRNVLTVAFTENMKVQMVYLLTPSFVHL